MRRKGFVRCAHAACLLICVVMLVAGCKAMPENHAVQQKDQKKFMSQVMETASPDQKQWDISRLTGTISSAKGDVTIELDAQIEADWEMAYPVYSISPRSISEKDAQQYIQNLIGDRPVYATDGGSSVISKDWIESRILSYKEMLNGLDSEEEKAALQYEIEYIQGKYEDAPASRYEKPALLAFAPLSSQQNLKEFEYEWETFGRVYGVEATQEEYDEQHEQLVQALKNPSDKATLYIEGIADMGDGDEAYVCVYKNKSNKENGIEFSRYKLDDKMRESFGDYEKEDVPVAMDRGDALTIAKQMVEKLGIDYMAEVDIEEDVPDITNHHFVFVRAIHGVPITVVENNESMMTAYREQWDQERMDIWVDDKGVCRLQWSSPTELNESLNSDVALKPMEEIASILKQQIATHLSYGDSGEDEKFIVKREYTITQAKLGSMVVAQPGTGNQYLVVPVWDFYGYCTLTYSPEYLDQPGHAEIDENNQRKEEYPNYSYLTINAVDGTIVNRTQGY